MFKTYYPDAHEQNFTVTKILNKRPLRDENFTGIPQLGSGGNPYFREKEESTKPKRKPRKKTTKKKKCDCDNKK